MNFIAGCLLLFMDEEDTFWCLAIIVEELLPGYFSMAMVEPQVPLLTPASLQNSSNNSNVTATQCYCFPAHDELGLHAGSILSYQSSAPSAVLAVSSLTIWHF